LSPKSDFVELPTALFYCYKVESTECLPKEVSLLFGEILNGLRASLDHVVYELSGGIDGNGESSGFLFDENRSALKTNLGLGTGKGKKEMRGVPENIKHKILDDIQPYLLDEQSTPGKGADLFKMNKLRNIDTHRLLLTVERVHRMTIGLEEFTLTGENRNPKGYIYAGTEPLNLEQDTKIVAEILINEKDYFYNEPLINCLISLAKSVNSTIHTIESI